MNPTDRGIQILAGPGKLTTDIMNLIERLPIQIIGKRLYLRRQLEVEGQRIFACLQTEEARRIIGSLPPLPVKRAVTDRYYLVRLAYWLDLPKAKPMRILDIGSYTGFWPFLCRAYGHDATCTDLPGVLARDEVQAMLKILQVPSMPLRIEALKPVGDIGAYDLITGLRTRFHSTMPKETGCPETHWGIEEWDFFLKDLVKHVRPGGQIFFKLNRLQENGKGAGVPRTMQTYFRSHGAQLTGPCLWFKDLERIQKDS